MTRLREVSISVLLAAALMAHAPACDDDGGSVADTSTADTSGEADTTAVEDTAVAEDTSSEEDTSDEDTTMVEDTSDEDTTTVEDTAVADTTPPATLFDEPHAIFAAKCASCHTGSGSGGHNMGGSDVAQAYSDSQLSASSCSGLTKGACALVRIQSGAMPMGAGCTGDPTQDAGKSQCLTQAEQDVLQAWIDGGQLPPE